MFERGLKLVIWGTVFWGQVHSTAVGCDFLLAEALNANTKRKKEDSRPIQKPAIFYSKKVSPAVVEPRVIWLTLGVDLRKDRALQIVDRRIFSKLHLSYLANPEIPLESALWKEMFDFFEEIFQDLAKKRDKKQSILKRTEELSGLNSFVAHSFRKEVAHFDLCISEIKRLLQAKQENPKASVRVHGFESLYEEDPLQKN